jgi:hypothetical protein
VTGSPPIMGKCSVLSTQFAKRVALLHISKYHQ